MLNYMHIKGHEDQIHHPSSNYSVSQEKIINYCGAHVLAVEINNNGKIHTEIPGFIESYKQKENHTGLKISETINIVVKEDKKNIESLVKDMGLKGPVCFL